MSEPDFFTVTRKGPVAYIGFNRPPINMMSFQACGSLEKILLLLGGDRSLSIVVLTSCVKDYFIAHADVSDIMRMENNEPPVGDPAAWDRVTALLEYMPQITVAAVNGQAWGGGCEICLACTFRLLSENGHFRLMEVSKGVIPGAGGTARLPRIIGIQRAAQMLLSGRIVKAGDAVAMGLADALLPENDFMLAVDEWLAPIAASPPHALAGAKAALFQGTRMTFDEALTLEATILSDLISCDETKALGEKTIDTL